MNAKTLESSAAALNERAQLLLKALVENYIREGHPVASRRLSKESGIAFSPATIRNVMADLEEFGFITAPHTSAGRVPTVKGYRFFIDTLLAVKPLKSREITRLERQLECDSASSSKELAKAASAMLSNLTHLAGVVTVPKREHAKLSQIEFLRLAERRFLVILVFDDQEVQNRIIHFERDLSDGQLREAANYLTSKLAGSDINKVRSDLLQELKQTHDHMNALMIDAITMAQHAFERGEAAGAEFVVAGEINLMDVAELSDREKLRGVFEAFNEQRDLLRLFDQSLTADGVEIFIGEESGYKLFDDLSVVTAPYRVKDDVVGVLGVIGPTRMAYQRVIPIVDVTAKLLASALNSKT